MSKTTINLAAVKAVIRADLTRARNDYAFAVGILLALAAVAAMVQMVGAGFARVGYPYTLEWMEGGIVDHVRVVLSGKPLYREPSFAWTPFIYPPFYYWVCAAFMKVFGVSLFWARLVSLLSTLGCLALIGAFVRKEGGGAIGALVASGLFAITFKVTGFWIDLARVDALFFLLFLGGVYLTRFGKTPLAAGISGLLLFLSFFTKQTALALSIPVLLAGMALDRRRGLITAGVAIGLGVGAVQWMDLSSGGWFRYYIFKIPSQHSSAWDEWYTFFIQTFWSPMPIALVLSLLALGVALRGRAVIALYAGLVIVGWVHAFTGMLHNGGYLNALIPYCGFLSILAGLAIGWVISQDGKNALVKRLQAVAIAVVFLQFGVLAYDQRAVVPRKRDLTTGNAVIERWKKLHEHGEVLSFAFNYYGMLAGETEIHAHTMALSDVFKTNDSERISLLLQDILKTLRSYRYRTILYDASLHFVHPEVENTLRAAYHQRGQLFEPGLEDDRTWPRTGFGCRPNEIFTPP